MTDLKTEEGLKVRLAGILFGVIAGLFSIGLWVIFVFYNPYSSTPVEGNTVMTTFLMLCLPALLAIFSSFIQKEYLMFIAFILSLPISFYLFGTPGIFRLFFASCIAYFIGFLLLFFSRKNRVQFFKSEKQ
ncbi:MAG: hypothetical protein C0P75_012295 [Bacilli bacterium]|jgi:hypothetical protein|uniref:hypothetical protein n=1 Tax=Ureibacillus sp. FSL W7-1570 TaxID=2954593 RepID=UPI001EB0C864|nr:hypothetical protein [Bacilli bacterium]